MTHRRDAVPRALVCAGALAAFAGLWVVLSPPPQSALAQGAAARALAAAREAPSLDAVADRVAGQLPEDARAVVVLPVAPHRPPGRAGSARVCVLVGQLDPSSVRVLSSVGGVIGSTEAPDGWQAAVSVPVPVEPPLGAALSLLLGAAVLGAAATELPRRRTAAARREEHLVRGLCELLPGLPDRAAWRLRTVLVAAGVRVLVPDGDPVDPTAHRVVGTEPTGDAALAGTVARTVRPGFADGDRVLVPPAVVVFTASRAGR
ncbi:nucleotide exchange factor GrpE [Saccharothrix coeruleofusca]|uniref:GrpE protein n=1 Tax=Saccharothrix coeruleofusca TaxID=33919 RepID=A0A918ANL1_9PSEU|nr:nucleotide exchange factor GrpE [Saccharothrix coeruleofusca]MBP2337942.1 hypothetical protein [Saccharothrix coeruleofusca]GGP63225.1 hypothetical protein GCM10010185_39880 [Saccharothrix coeruleofusca]